MTGAARFLVAVMSLAASGLGPLSNASAESGSPSCTIEPSSKWIAEPEMRARIQDLGYRFNHLKTTKGGCYEIYGRDMAGKRVEIYFNPLTGEVVRKSS